MLKYLFAVAAVLSLLISGAQAGESGPVMNGKKVQAGKTECPKEAEARAKAALMLASVRKTSTAIAPAPKAKSKAKCEGNCQCGDLFGGCDCVDGHCPCCAKDKKVTPTSSPPLKSNISYYQSGNVIYECNNGVCRPVGTLGQQK